MRHTPLSRAAVTVALLGACSAEESPPAELPEVVERCPGVVDRGEDDPSPPGLFADPDAFDRAGCAGSVAPLDAIDPCGVWHLEVDLDGFGRFPGAVRVDLAAAEPADLEGLLFGREVSDVRLTERDLFLRWAGQADDGTPMVRALDACEVREDGSVAGQFAACYGDECAIGTFVGSRVDPLPEEPADGVTLVSEWRGPADAPWPEDAMTLNVRQRDGIAYVANHTDGLRVVDLTDPAAPADLGHAPVLYPDFGEFYNDVKVVAAGESIYAFMASDVRGVVVVDVTDPRAPAEVTAFPPPAPDEGVVDVHTLFVEGDRLYFTVGPGVAIYDLADPAAPVRLGGFVLPDVDSAGGFVHDLYVENGVAYLNYWHRGLVVVDARDPAAPVQLGVFDDYERRTSHSNWVTEAAGRRVSVHGDEGLGAHVRVVDVDPASATAFEEIGAYQTRPEVSVHNIMAVGERALVAYYQDGLRVLDLADPAAPAEIARFHTWPGPEPGYGRSVYEGAIGVEYDSARELVLLADTHRGLLVLSLDR